MASDPAAVDQLRWDPGQVAAKPQAEIAAFECLDLRIGTVSAVDSFPEARNPAYRLTVDFGPVIGMLHTSAQVTNYAPDSLIGRHVVAVVNLPPKRIAGFTSQFLVLGGLEPDGTVRLLTTDHDLPPGSVVA